MALRLLRGNGEGNTYSSAASNGRLRSMGGSYREKLRCSIQEGLLENRQSCPIVKWVAGQRTNQADFDHLLGVI